MVPVELVVWAKAGAAASSATTDAVAKRRNIERDSLDESTRFLNMRGEGAFLPGSPAPGSRRRAAAVPPLDRGRLSGEGAPPKETSGMASTSPDFHDMFP